MRRRADSKNLHVCRILGVHLFLLVAMDVLVDGLGELEIAIDVAAVVVSRVGG